MSNNQLLKGNQRKKDHAEFIINDMFTNLINGNK